jgi:site-specific DNA-methyltransferase (adenine-specific)
MAKRIETLAEGVTLYLGDCCEILPTVGKFDAVVTSPPYDGMRSYGGHEAVNTLAVINHIANGLSTGGVCVWNVADQVIDGSESGTSFRQALRAMECGLRLHDTMIYCKEGVTFPDENRYHPAFEYMFVFSNGKPRHFNGIKDWRNKWAGSKMHGTDRQPTGETTKISGNGREIPECGLRRNWWVISNPYNGDTKGHPAPMPYKLASDHIETWTSQGESIVDPFMGSGTTGVAAVKLGRRFLGIEIEEKYFDIACRRISEALKQTDLFVDRPKPAKQEASL